MTLEVAQRRLLEAIARRAEPNPESPDPLLSLAVGIDAAVDLATASGEDATADVFACLGSLVLAVRSDLHEKETAR